MSKIWKIAGFLPFLGIAFINAFVDLGHKVTIQNIVFKSYDGPEQILFTAIVNGLILLPYILFLTPAGFLSDKYPKNKVMRIAAWTAVGITIAITYCYYNGYFWPAFGLTFLLAIQSALYSPSKYGFIKELVGKNNIAPANGATQAVTIISILSGIVLFSYAFEAMIAPMVEGLTPYTIMLAIAPLGWVLIAGAMFEVILSYRLPTLTQTNKELKLDRKKYFKGQLLKEQMSTITKSQIIWLSIVGITIFWSISQVMLAAYPAFAKSTLGEANAFLIQVTMAMAGIGVLIGSLFAGKVSKNYIETGLIPLGAIGVAIGLFLLPSLTSLTQQGFAFFAIGFSGALFIIPLNSLIQYHADDESTGKVLAGNNFIQNIGMVTFLLITIGASLLALPSNYLFYFLSAVAALGAIYTIIKMPFSLVRIIISRMMSNRYKLHVEGFKNIPETGGVLMLGNHVSFVDWAMIQMASPRQVRFVMEQTYYNIWYLRWFFKVMGVVPISKGESKKALEDIGLAIKNGDVVCLFPEGKLSRHGQINEFKSGFSRAVADLSKDDGVIIPFYLRGLWGSKLSKASKGFKYLRKPNMKREIVIAFGEAIDIHSKPEVVKRRVQDMSFTAWKGYCEAMDTIPNKWIKTAKKNLFKAAIHDPISGKLTFHRALVASLAISNDVKSRCKNSQNIGILLPASGGSALVNMGVLTAGKTVVNINFSAAPESVSSAIEQSELKTVYTSKVFLKKLKAKGLDTSWLDVVEVVHMEDVMSVIKGQKAKMLGLMALTAILPASFITAFVSKAHDNSKVAAILFSSGSEGSPKGVMLSHRNIASNVEEISDVLNVDSKDIVLSSLPPFHAFGLSVTTFMPMLEGITMVTHPDPTDGLAIGKAVAKHKVTIMCGTSTFLNLYTRNRKVIPLMFESLRVVISGAEKLKDEVRKAFQDKFNKDIYEGYGATETTPVACANVPDQIDVNHWDVHTGQKKGTVGMPLPGTTVRIVDPETMEELDTDKDGLILIGGHQIMVGYLGQPEKTASVITEIDDIRWYKTGDKGHLDSDGFLTIVDRYSRFAKIGGEMVSLGAVEIALEKYLDTFAGGEFDIVASAVPDNKKGEVIIALIKGELDIELSKIKSSMNESGIGTLMRPTAFYAVDDIPLLGSGKINLAELNALAKELHCK
jgi:acyl-[acyl-carrier-protein]-phospholipid O-acyltransferase/long-chain-fatty-acid--[acyl-carrier-protein] ligase